MQFNWLNAQQVDRIVAVWLIVCDCNTWTCEQRDDVLCAQRSSTFGSTIRYRIDKHKLLRAPFTFLSIKHWLFFLHIVVVFSLLHFILFRPSELSCACLLACALAVPKNAPRLHPIVFIQLITWEHSFWIATSTHTGMAKRIKGLGSTSASAPSSTNTDEMLPPVEVSDPNKLL